MGIRLALGATPRGLTMLVVSEGIRPTLFGLAVGIGAAITAGWAVRSLLYEIAPFDFLTLTCVPAILLGAALLACYVPARRAASTDPALTLRDA